MKSLQKHVSPSSASEGSFKIRARPYENSPCYNERYPYKILRRANARLQDYTVNGAPNSKVAQVIKASFGKATD